MATQDAWDAMKDIAENTWSPRKGTRVNIVRGKHKGKSGIVFWHGTDKYAYVVGRTAIQDTMREIIGKYGYRIGVRTDDGKKIFTSAEYAANQNCRKCGGSGFVEGSKYCDCM